MERSRAGGARVSTVLLPSSLTSESRDPRQGVYRVGVVARALAIFRVEEAVIYRDPFGPDDAHRIVTLLEYAETPQYLRRRLFPLREELRDAGLLPPLRTPHHPVEARVRRLQAGEVREGVVVRGRVYIGVEELAHLQGSPLPEGERVTVRVVSRAPLVVEGCEPPRGVYWGYRVGTAPGLGKALGRLRGMDILLTSRRGERWDQNLKYQEGLNSPHVAAVFGSPERGVHELLGAEGLRPENFRARVVNTLPGQGVETVRVEEALMATLAIVNVLPRPPDHGQENATPARKPRL